MKHSTENEINPKSEVLVAALSSKVSEQIEITKTLINLFPMEKLEWQPTANSFRAGDLLGHLLECLAGFCAVLFAIRPNELSDFTSLRDLPVNHFCELEEARKRINEYEECIKEGFADLCDSDLAKRSEERR